MTFVFAEHPVRRVPVVDHGVVVGMVTLDDIVVRLAGDLHAATSSVNAQLLAAKQEPKQWTSVDLGDGMTPDEFLG